MAAYLIFIRESEIRDPVEYDKYSALGRAAGAGHEATPLVMYGAHEVLEGEDVEGIVIVQFPTVEAAKAFYDSPGYQEALPHRLKSADYRVIVVQGL
jgi:uncharacterized protein (DUF1330 family)